MRRISAQHAKPGMILSRSVYDSRGNEVIETSTQLTQDLLDALSSRGVGQIIIDDWRVADVPVQPLFSSELEASATQALHELMTESHGSRSIDDTLLQRVENSIYAMTRELFPEVIGEVNTSGCLSIEDYRYVQPVRVAGLSLLLGKRAGYGFSELASLGIAAMLKDIGYVLLPQRIEQIPEPLPGKVLQAIQKHPQLGTEILGQYERFGHFEAEAIVQHHERWDGSGYPGGLVGSDITAFARILAIADTYFELVSRRPNRRAFMPHEAAEYITACSGKLFDPVLVTLFATQVTFYPTGLTVQLNTGELGIVSGGSPECKGRPVVRICFDRRHEAVENPYDIDLAEAEHVGQSIARVLYYW